VDGKAITTVQVCLLEPIIMINRSKGSSETSHRFQAWDVSPEIH